MHSAIPRGLSVIAALFFGVGGVAAQGVHRCNVNGEIRYQQFPCENSGTTVGDDIRRKKQEAAAADQAAQQKTEAAAQAEQKRRARILAAPAGMLSPVEIAERDLWRAQAATKTLNDRMRDGTFDREFKARLDKYCGGHAYARLHVGLTEEQVLNCTDYRIPEVVNVTTTVAGVSKQYVFNRFGKREYLYFQNGRLTAFQ